jgi:uncharacterized protein (UPF0335 family)
MMSLKKETKINNIKVKESKMATKEVVRELVEKLTSIENEMGLLRDDQKEVLKEYEDQHGVDVKALKAALRIAKIRAKLGDSTYEADQMLEYIDE